MVVSSAIALSCCRWLQAQRLARTRLPRFFAARLALRLSARIFKLVAGEVICYSDRSHATTATNDDVRAALLCGLGPGDFFLVESAAGAPSRRSSRDEGIFTATYIASVGLASDLRIFTIMRSSASRSSAVSSATHLS